MTQESDENSSVSKDGLYLFTTKTCPNCGMAKTYLEGVDFKVIDAEENMEITSELGIMQAPTLVEVKDGEIKKYVNASNIKRFAEDNCLTV
ncbi:glutaredoxin domain-containing protein [Anaerosporobacter sp.]|uniref:glutaredoxin family protein n=1 Tax=Anaerosporobacter sp. TaxID=1872529 RepID=UPI002F3EF09F